MPQVPYNPVPNVTPQGQVPRVGINAVGDAFGENIAGAISHLGQVGEHASDEIFARAVALQNLNNETEAKEADAKYMVMAGQLHADYNALEGKARVDAFPDYQKNLNETRTKIREGLSNPMAQRMYDSSSLSTMGRSIFNGAGAAASAQRDYVKGTAKASIDLDAKTVEDNPNDENLFQDKLHRVRSNAATLSAVEGFEEGGPQEKDLTLKATSKLWAQRITGLARAEPFSAAKMLDEHKTELTQDDFLKVDNTVRSQGRAVESINIANKIYTEGQETDKRPQKSLAQMEEDAKALALKHAPDDPILAQHAVAAVRGLWNQNKYAKTQEDYANSQIVNGAIVAGVKDERELRLDPKVAAAIDALPPTKQREIPGIINRTNAARDKVTNEENDQRIRGVANNDPRAFLDMDLTKEHLSYPDLKRWQAAQQKAKENPQADPRVDRAKRLLRGSLGAQLQALGIYNRTDANKDDYDLYTGTLSSALDVWQDSHAGKAATPRDIIETIGPDVLKQRKVPGMLWGTNQEPFYKPDTSSKGYKDFSKAYTAEHMNSEGIEPDQTQVDRAYNRFQLMKLYGKPKSE